jgi:hypothetical protein
MATETHIGLPRWVPTSHFKAYQITDLDGKQALSCGNLPSFIMYFNGNSKKLNG